MLAVRFAVKTLMNKAMNSRFRLSSLRKVCSAWRISVMIKIGSLRKMLPPYFYCAVRR